MRQVWGLTEVSPKNHGACSRPPLGSSYPGGKARKQRIASPGLSPVHTAGAQAVPGPWNLVWAEPWLEIQLPKDWGWAVSFPSLCRPPRFPETVPRLAGGEGHRHDIPCLCPRGSLHSVWLQNTNHIRSFCLGASRGHLEMIFKASSMSWSVSK